MSSAEEIVEMFREMGVVPVEEPVLMTGQVGRYLKPEEPRAVWFISLDNCTEAPVEVGNAKLAGNP